MIQILFIALLILLALSAFFSSVETALMSVSNIKVKSLVKQKKRGSEALSRIKKNPEKLLITILVGNNLVNISAAALSTVIFTELFGSIGVGIATGIMTFMILVFGEITPKAYASQNAESMSLRIARPIEILSKILRPITWLLEKITSAMMRLFGSERKENLTEEELKTMVTMGAEQGLIKKQVAEMMESLIRFEKTQADEIMTPKSDMELIDGNMTIEKALDFFVKTPFSRYPVYDKSPERIVGIADVDKVLEMIKERKLRKKVIDISKKPHFIPETKDLSSLITDFEKWEYPIAIVVDEYGHIMGLVTLDDVLEEIVGDIFDKSKRPNSYVKVVSRNELIVDGRTKIEVLDDYVDLKINDKDFDTVSGLVLKKMGKIPKAGQTVRFKRFRIKIEDATEKNIRRVRIIKD